MSELDMDVLIGGVDRGVVSEVVVALPGSPLLTSGRDRCDAVELGLVSIGMGGDGWPL